MTLYPGRYRQTSTHPIQETDHRTKKWYHLSLSWQTNEWLGLKRSIGKGSLTRAWGTQGSCVSEGSSTGDMVTALESCNLELCTAYQSLHSFENLFSKAALPTYADLGKESPNESDNFQDWWGICFLIPNSLASEWNVLVGKKLFHSITHDLPTLLFDRGHNNWHKSLYKQAYKKWWLPPIGVDVKLQKRIQ